MPPKRNRAPNSGRGSSDGSFGPLSETSEPVAKKRRTEDEENLSSTMADDLSPKSNTSGPLTPNPPNTEKLTSKSSSTLIEQLASSHLAFEELTTGEILGTGAFGSVYKGQFRGTPVAIKILHSQDKSAEEMFLKEADIMFKLRHPNIVNFMGACVTPPNCCIVMELYPMNLASVIKKGGIPDDKIFHRIILGIAQGLNYLHMGNPQVIHRDLKPANILLDWGYCPRIADFGVSREKAKATLTMTRIGTPTYCAPEVLNSEHYSTKVDIYSFGMLMFSMVAGGSPWKDENLAPIQIMMKIAVKQERPVIPASCRTDFRNVITCCWKHDPNQRPDAAELIFMIERIKPDLPPPPDILEPTVILPTTVALDQTQTPINSHQNHNLSAQTSPSTHSTHTHSPPKPSESSNPNHSTDVSVPTHKTRKTCPYDATCYRFDNQQHSLGEAHPQRDAYRELCRTFLKDKMEISAEDRTQLLQYKNTFKISEKVHKWMIESIGWTLSELTNGTKTH